MVQNYLYDTCLINSFAYLLRVAQTFAQPLICYPILPKASQEFLVL